MKILYLVFLLLLFSCSNRSYYKKYGSGFDPDMEKNSINYQNIEKKFGKKNIITKKYKIGAVMKFFGNQYWQFLANGMMSKAKEYGLNIEIHAGASESDLEGQLIYMKEMVSNNFDAILVSPQTNSNLNIAVKKAREKNILIINVDDAVLDDADYFVGPNQYENGVRVAKYFIQKFSDGGNIAIIKGLPDVYAVNQRTNGFVDTLKGRKFTIVASEYCNWELQIALEKTNKILQEYPNIIGFYANNDIMALGVVESLKINNRLKDTIVIGTDGIEAAYYSIRNKEMTATIDSFPYITGMVAIEIAIRILEGQDIPRVVFSPQNLIAFENLDNPLEEYFKEKKNE
ncbi:MAG: hypothetical protein A2Y34_01320 [Spirochaetes bacterium GWC1_27_15]|nr:MAG: hypothetical protein A2Z98_07380 [Spirochaetes bacterium GWB1_27_13]OHD21475.1 MAG: hypothetical protein A2Y34_01320 [Spirochaetes bacterium GWC1_27_15]